MILAFQLWDLETEHARAEWILLQAIRNELATFQQSLLTNCKRQTIDNKYNLPFVTVQILHFICSFTSINSYTR